MVKVKLRSLKNGDKFEFNNKKYMKIKLNNVSYDYELIENDVSPVVNLDTGVVSLISNDEKVTKWRYNFV